MIQLIQINTITSGLVTECSRTKLCFFWKSVCTKSKSNCINWWGKKFVFLAESRIRVSKQKSKDDTLRNKSEIRTSVSCNLPSVSRQLATCLKGITEVPSFLYRIPTLSTALLRMSSQTFMSGPPPPSFILQRGYVNLSAYFFYKQPYFWAP